MELLIGGDLEKLAKWLRYIARTVLIIVTSFWFLFALLSGSEAYGGGIKGILKNSPNALPWLLLGIVVYLAFRWELLGGLLVAAMGIFTVFFFKAYNQPVVLFMISVPLLILGGFLIAAWYLTKKSAQTKPR